MEPGVAETGDGGPCAKAEADSAMTAKRVAADFQGMWGLPIRQLSRNDAPKAGEVPKWVPAQATGATPARRGAEASEFRNAKRLSLDRESLSAPRTEGAPEGVS